MKKEVIAVPYEDGKVFQHFGHAPTFKIYETTDRAVLKGEIITPHGGGHGAMADFLTVIGATKVICGGIGQGAIDALATKGISVVSGIEGGADAKVQAYVDGMLTYGTAATCKKHEEEKA